MAPIVSPAQHTSLDCLLLRAIVCKIALNNICQTVHNVHHLVNHAILILTTAYSVTLIIPKEISLLYPIAIVALATTTLTCQIVYLVHTHAPPA
jgi:hypothetical protein